MSLVEEFAARSKCTFIELVGLAPDKEMDNQRQIDNFCERLAGATRMPEAKADCWPKAFDALENGGVLAAISFHPLEDRIVKKFFKKMAGRPESRFDTSYVQDRVKLAELLTRKPIVPSDGEIAENPRSRSSKLRAIRKDTER